MSERVSPKPHVQTSSSFFFCARLFISVARSFLVVLRYVMYTSGFANDVTFAYYNCQKQATLKGIIQSDSTDTGSSDLTLWRHH